MRTTVVLDDELMQTASKYTGLTEKSAILREALKSLVAREAGRRLAALGGSAPGLKLPLVQVVDSSDFSSTGFLAGRRSGKRMTSRMERLPVRSMVRRSMPMPSPPVGGRP